MAPNWKGPSHGREWPDGKSPPTKEDAPLRDDLILSMVIIGLLIIPCAISVLVIEAIRH